LNLLRIEAVREDVLDEDNAIEQWPDLVTVPDVADILGVTQQRVRVLAATVTGIGAVGVSSACGAWRR
jgi:predicted transcriptional regulator of viral defense system